MSRRQRVRQRINVARLERRCITLKICHETRDAALAAAELQMLAGRVEPGCHLTPYLCDECHRWHLRNRQIVPVLRDPSRRPSGQERR